MTFRTGTGSQAEWVQSWTIYYWAWWISLGHSSDLHRPHLQGADHPSSCSAYLPRR